MKLILYNPPSSAGRKPVLPMSLLALGAVLEGRHEYVIVDGNLDGDPAGTIDALVRNWGARALAVTVMPGPQLAAAVPFCTQIKRTHPRLTIIWGGYFPTQHWDVCLAAPYVDFVVRGHGELVLRGLLDALEADALPAQLPGLAYRDGAGAPASNPLAPIPHPNELPDFPYQKVDVRRYVRRTFMGARTLPHHSSYGCPFFCNFCAVVNMVSGRWLAQSAERTANVARTLAERFAADAVELYDNNFFVHEGRTAEFASRITPLGISWWGESRIDTLLRYAERSWVAMRDSGLKMLFLGAESGSDETLKRMNKGGSASTEKTLAIVDKTRRYGIVPELSFVLGNPPDPVEDTLRTLEFIRRIKRINPAAEIVLYMYSPVPLDGELYEHAKAAGFRFPDTLEEWISPAWQRFAQHRSTEQPWLPVDVRRHVRDFERVLNAYYPTVTDVRLRGVRRALLRTAGGWRYHLRVYRHPVELRALHRVFAYQRPETSGF